MKKFSFPFVILIAAAFILAACAPNTPQPAALVTSSEPDTLIAEGRLMPVSSLDHSFSIPGQVAEILVIDGDNVKAGQVLARLADTPETQLALTQAEQEGLLARQALDQLKSAAEVNLAQERIAVIASQKQLETAQERYDADETDENLANLDAAVALLDQSEQTLAKLETGAGVDPDQLSAAQARVASADAAAASAQAAVDAQELSAAVDGMLVDLTLQFGQRVSAGQPVLTLADFSSWVVKTDNLSEVDVVNLKVGQKVEVILDALPGSILSGEVTHINARFEEKRGDITYTVTMVLNQTDPLMRWGMTAAVQFIP